MLRPKWMTPATILIAAVALTECQKPTGASDTPKVDAFVDATSPAMVSADPSTDGRTYRVTRNNEPDLIVPYQFKTSFAVTITMNGKSTDKKYDVDFPVTLSSASVKVSQASGGIITPPQGGDTERYEFVVTQASGNKFGGANTSISMNFDVWYTLPSQQKEAVITATFNLVDDEGSLFVKTVTINVSP